MEMHNPPPLDAIDASAAKRLAEITAESDRLGMDAESWAHWLAWEFCFINEQPGHWAGRAQTEVQYMKILEANKETLPLRYMESLQPVANNLELPPKWDTGLFLLKGELRAWVSEHRPEMFGRILGEHKSSGKAATDTTTPGDHWTDKARAYAESLGNEQHAMQAKWCYWSNAAYALAHRQTNEDESQARRLLKKLGHYLEPLGNSFPFPAPELTAEMLEKHPSLKDAPRDCNALLKLKMHRELTYATDLKKLDVAGKIAFYDPVTMRRIAKDEAADPIVMLDEIAQQLMELAARDADEKSATKESSTQPQGEPVQAGSDKPAPKVDAATGQTTTHKIHRNHLDPVIDKAITEAGRDETADVYLKLKEMALAEEAPFTGELNGDALCYTDDNNKAAQLTKNALAKRLKNRRKRR